MKVIHLILINLLIYASVYGQELIKFQENGKYGFRDENGNIIIPAKYDNADDFYDGLAKVGSRSSDKYGIIDKTGKEITPLKYDVIGDFSEGLARVREKHWSVGGKYGMKNIVFISALLLASRGVA